MWREFFRRYLPADKYWTENGGPGVCDASGGTGKAGLLAGTPSQSRRRLFQQHRATGIAETGLNGSVRPLEGQESHGGSSDVGDVSWLVPTLHLSVTTAADKSPWHGRPMVACGGMSIGHKGMIHAAKTLSTTMVDLFEDSNTRAAIRAEFAKQTEGVTYKPYIPEGRPPVPGR